MRCLRASPGSREGTGQSTEESWEQADVTGLRMTVDAMGADEVTKVGGRACRWRGMPGTPTFKPVTQSHDGRTGERRREWPTGSVVLNGESDGSVSAGFDTVRLPDDLRDNGGRLNQELGSVLHHRRL